MNTGYTFRFHEPPTAYSILSPSGTLMVKIMLDGTIEYGEGYTPDAASRVFWEAMAAHRPACEIDSLRAQLAAAEAERDRAVKLLRRVGPALATWKRDGEKRYTDTNGVFHLEVGPNHYHAIRLADEIDAASAAGEAASG